MPTMNIQDAQANLIEIIDGLTPGEPLVITKEGKPVAMLFRTPKKEWPCKAGSAKGSVHWMAPDFDAPLDEFKEYME
jgi:antitoxin (DNA-binding transcriptional repressor) of toxin-antitoxin stability system